MKKIIQLSVAVLALVGSATGLRSQEPGYTNFDNYTPVNCSGEIPGIFLMSAQEKYKLDVKDEAQNSKNKYVGKAKGDFLFQSNYFIDMLLQSGKVLFGDSISNYVNTVADRVLINEPDLRAKLTFYTLRSEEPNAFSTDQGLIFVTVGLIAQLENEAQLAFILSHEIAHFEKRHTLEIYMAEQDMQRRTYDVDEKIRDFSNHEKESEFEADSLGLARLSRTGYDCAEAMGAMFVMQFSHLPMEDYDFESRAFERPMMIFPSSLFLDKIKPITLDNDSEDDSYSSHPNISRRRARLEEQYEDLSVCGTEKFAGTEAQFYMIREICRYEVVRLEIIARNYPRAVYNATFLQKAHPNSLYLKRAIAKSLYCMAKYENLSRLNDGMDNYNKVEGKAQQCYFLFQKMNDEQVTAVALRTLYDLSLIDSSVIIKAMLTDLGTDAVYYHNMTLEEMQKTVNIYKEALADTVKPDTIPKVVAVEEKKDSTPVNTGYVSKYDKLRTEKKKKDKQEVTEKKTVEKSRFHMLAFGDIIEDKQVIAFFRQCEDLSEIRTREKEVKEGKYKGMSSYEERKAKQKEDKKDLAPKALGIDTLLVVDPFYMYATERDGYKLQDSERGRYALCDQVTEVAGAASLPIVLFSVKEFGKDDVEKYNELALLNEWIEESANHDEVTMLQAETEFTQAVCDKYHAKNIFVTGVFTFKQKRENRGFVLLFTIICYPLLPFGIVYAATPEHQTYIVSGIYNVATSETEMTRVTRLKAKARQGYIASQLYDIFTGIQEDPAEPSKKTKR
ncbi:MAG TPA: M48 family metallopeptidase [Bacteroidia bacterium]|nr:M48 family metallopeptidase [Bacteroidia bacterium]